MSKPLSSEPLPLASFLFFCPFLCYRLLHFSSALTFLHVLTFYARTNMQTKIISS